MPPSKFPKPNMSLRRLYDTTERYSKLLLFWLLGAIACVFVACDTVSTGGIGADIVVGSKNFTEQVILGELLAQHIEAQTDLKVDRRLNLGGTFICHQALVAGQIDLYVEYTGTAYAAILKQPTIADPAEVYRYVKAAYDQQFQLQVGEPLGFENTYAMTIRREDMKRLNLETISDLARLAPRLRAGFGYEFVEREDGFPGLAVAYDIKFKHRPEVLDIGLMYRALVEKKVDVISVNSTDGAIRKLNLFVLEDDKRYFPPYEAVPLVRQATLDKYPQLQAAIAQLGGILTAEKMQRLNYQVDGEFRRVEDVVREFLATEAIAERSTDDK